MVETRQQTDNDILRSAVEAITKTLEEQRKWMESNENRSQLRLDSLEQRIEAMFVRNGDTAESSRTNNPRERSYIPPTRLTKVDFPKFDGAGVEGWLISAEQFFRVDHTADITKVEIAPIHFQGDARLWYGSYIQSRSQTITLTWDVLRSDLLQQFIPSVCESPINQLMNLKQKGSIQDYNLKYMAISQKLINMPDEYVIECYLSGIHEEISNTVRLLKPDSLNLAMAITKVQEATFKSLLKRGHLYNSSPPILPKPNQSKHTWRCLRIFLPEPVDSSLPPSQPPSNDEPSISIHALNGSKNYQTLRISGKVGQLSITILIDTGSTHNFINSRIMNNINHTAQQTSVLPVKGKNYLLQGMDQMQINIMEGDQISKLLMKGGQAALVQLRNCEEHQGHFFALTAQEPHNTDEELENILKQFGDLFQEPKELPPPRGHDHQIPLKEGTMPICLKPYSKSWSDHLQHLRMVLEVLEGVAADPHKLEATSSWPIPNSIKQLRGFLGLTGYYRRFIKGYALPDFSQPFVVETDASNVGIGAVLVQNNRPIAYISRALQAANNPSSTYERELLALTFAVEKWRPYLRYSPFIVKTDHESLKHLLEQRVQTPAQEKWLYKLVGYDFTVQYKKGKENVVVDALSRR
ncbi:uncharacterized protein LOC124943023 [Impatiens glandulifera]|uniref:uncharacterized protein LOC124943023 n=1 Tax=Impatiens glandulifera TaxID=253017 RepID=UPI001FB104D7|nr:uncharacterized protein LOC124943023 [Impatiens glandulifera]